MVTLNQSPAISLTDLKQAISQRELVLYYQPKIEISTRNIKGVEALVRWQHPDMGIVFPNQFIPIAEQSNLIVPLGEWVLKEALQQIQKWNNQGITLSTSINISPKQLHTPSFHSILFHDSTILHQIELEITESSAIQSPVAIQALLKQWQNHGIQMAIDDFGSGYAGLKFLHQLPANTLKIDQYFVHHLTKSDIARSIVKFAISLAHELGMKTVAEGVETKEQLRFLQDHHCDMAQGFLFSKPVPPHEIEKRWFK